MKVIFQLFKKIRQLKHTYLLPFVTMNLCVIVTRIIQVVFPNVLFKGLSNNSITFLLIVISLYLIGIGMAEAGKLISIYFKEKNEYYIKTMLTAELYDAVTTIGFSNYEQYDIRKKIELAKEGLSKGNISSVIDNVTAFISNLIFILSVSYVFRYFDWKISLLLILSIGINAICEYRRVKYDYDCYAEFSETNTRMIYARDKLTWKQFEKEIRIFNLYEYVVTIAKKYINSLSKIQETKSKRVFVVYLLLSLYDMFQRFGLLAYIVWLCVQGTISIGYFSSMIIAVISCFAAINANAKIIVQIVETKKYLLSYFEVFDYVAEKTNKSNRTVPAQFQKLNVINLSFGYPGGQGSVLNDVTVSFEAGKKYGIVGRNGSGKTTFVKVLLGLYEVPDRTILLDEKDINSYSRESWYSMFSTIMQDFHIYAYTLRDNLTMLRNDIEVNEDDVIEGIALDDYLSYEYESGREVSGGEAQKIAFLRVCKQNSNIMVLDEPTAALSPDAEIDFYESIKNKLNEQTLILVSHRLASCKLCDEILVFDEGRIVEKGTHSELMEQQGLYCEMFNKQKELYTSK